MGRSAAAVVLGGVVVVLGSSTAEAGRCGFGCTSDDYRDRCSSYWDCDEDRYDDIVCCCEDDYSSSRGSCHPGDGNKWESIQTLSRTTTSSCTWDLNGCSHFCSEQYSVAATETTLTLTPTANPPGCYCSSGQGMIDSSSDAVPTGAFGDGSRFNAFTPHEPNEMSVTIVHTCSDTTGCDGGTCTINYAITEREIDMTAASAAAGIWLILSCLAFVIPLGGIHLCIKSKAQMGARPTPMAWLGCTLIFFFTGPCFMWIPFVLDGCYQSSSANWNVNISMDQQYGGGGGGYGQQMQPGYGQQTQQPIMATAVAVPQPTVAQATAVAMPTATATAAAIPASGAPPGYGGQQPPVATVTATPQ